MWHGCDKRVTRSPSVHRFEVLPEGELVVLSFHTVAEEDLLEVSAAGERTCTDPAETS